MKATYLDHNATSPLRPRARGRWLELVDEGWAHAGSLHGPGVAARRVLEEASAGLARALGAAPSALVLTSGATESNLTALQSLSVELGRRGPARWAVGAGEHPSVFAALSALEARGLATSRIVRLRSDGAIDLDDLDGSLGEADALCLQVANHETGALNDLSAVGERVLAAGVAWHADAVQAIGRVPFHFETSGCGAITTASVSGHKLGGPKGVGLLLKRAPFHPLLPGDHGDDTPRAGTPDVPGAGATLVALEAALHELGDGEMDRVARLRDTLERGIVERHPDAVVHAGATPRLPNTLSISIPGRDGAWPDGEELVLELAAQGVACSTGAACATGTGRPSPVLSAMGAPPEMAAASLRFSLAATSTEDDVREALSALERAL